MANKYTILIVDDDPNILDAFQLILEDKKDCEYFLLGSFEQVKDTVRKNIINLALVDVVLPETDGYEICKYLRTNSNSSLAYIIIMSADKSQLLDRIKSFKVGAQEFLNKPFDLKEVELNLMNKIELYRRQTEQKDLPVNDSEFFTKGRFVIDNATKRVMLNNKNIELTNLEFQLLHYFMLNSERVIELGEIGKVLWGEDNKATTDNARSLIHRLRMKIESDTSDPVYIIKTKVTSGYIFYPGGNYK